MSGKKMGSCKGTFDFLFEKQILPNKRVFLEIFKNVFQWDTFSFPGDSMHFIMMLYDKALVTELVFYVSFELNFFCLTQGTSVINQGAKQSPVTHQVSFTFSHAIVPTFLLGKLFSFSWCMFLFVLRPRRAFLRLPNQ